MTKAKQKEPIIVTATGIHGTTVRLRAAALASLLFFAMGFAIGGIVTPYLKFKPDVSETSDDSILNTRNQILIAIGSQTIWAAPNEGAEPIDTNLSVEQLVGEYEVMAQQAGYESAIEFERKENTVEARFSFKEPDPKKKKKFLLPNAKPDFPKTLALIFTNGTEPGTIVLSEIRQDGKTKSNGAAFVDLVKFGVSAPSLAQGQLLTSKGVFEIRANEKGAVALIDGKQVFPYHDEEEGLKIALDPNDKKEELNFEGAPQVLQLAGIEPNGAILKERIVLIAHDAKPIECATQAIIIDVERGKTEVIPFMLRSPNLKIENSNRAFLLSGFCETDKANNNPNLKIIATYNLNNGQISIARTAIAQNQQIAAETKISEGKWRVTSPTRLASPIGVGSALVSLSCAGKGGINIGVAGIPAPQNGSSSKIMFGNSGGNEGGIFSWSASSSSYHIQQANNAEQVRQIIRILKSGGDIRINGEGISKTVPSADIGQINTLMSVCQGEIKSKPQVVKTVESPTKALESAKIKEPPKAPTKTLIAQKPAPAKPKPPEKLTPKQ